MIIDTANVECIFNIRNFYCMLCNTAQKVCCKTYSKFYQLLVIKGRAVGGGLSNGHRGDPEASRSRCACLPGSAAKLSRRGGGVAGARPLGGRYILKAPPSPGN